ncbi:MAG: hypothetical protein H6577_19460 [Lewinellaceae bacterium]|nr:hypothetical protein [Saprospiraceae bacterium]MCB9340305.1 hypothetical protein [Lewinellaceae bacterium]
MKTTIVLIWGLLVFSCSQGQQSVHEKEPVQATKTVEAESTGLPQTGEFVPKNPVQAKPFNREFIAGQVTFKVSSDETGKGQVNIFADTNNKKSFSREFEVTGNIGDAFLLDLDADGFSEMYLVINKAPHPEIKGYSSYQNRSAGEIVVKDDIPTGAVASHILTRDGKLFREIKDGNGGTKEQSYLLEKSETSFILAPSK